MATYIVCTADSLPCPAADQVLLSEIGVDDFAAIGVTPASMAYAISFGFAFVLVAAALGIGIGAAIKSIRKL